MFLVSVCVCVSSSVLVCVSVSVFVSVIPCVSVCLGVGVFFAWPAFIWEVLGVVDDSAVRCDLSLSDLGSWLWPRSRLLLSLQQGWSGS